ncbi:MAG: ATP-binding domain-containing protein [Oleispira sp.]
MSLKTRREILSNLTRQSSKGLEFKTVILAGLGTLKVAEKDQADEVRLLYVGMTRAREKLTAASARKSVSAETLFEYKKSDSAKETLLKRKIQPGKESIY